MTTGLVTLLAGVLVGSLLRRHRVQVAQLDAAHRALLDADRVAGISQGELNQARERLRRMEGQQRAIFGDSPVPMWIHCPTKGCVMAANAAASSSLGLVEGAAPAEGSPAHSLGWTLDTLATRRAEERAAGEFWSFPLPDGRRLAAHLQVRDLEFAGMPCLLVTALVQPHTPAPNSAPLQSDMATDAAPNWDDEKRRFATDLRLLRRAVETTDSGIVITDATLTDHPIIYVNPAFERITGCTSEQLVGRNCRFLQGSDREQAAVDAIRSALQGGRDVRVTLRNYRHDGSLFWNDLHLTPLRAPDGEVTHHVAIVNDVTEQRHYEEQLAFRATHDDLTGLPNRQLLVDRLEQAIRVADRSNSKVAVMFIDLDDFKLINDTLGHAAGDKVLRAVASRLSGLVRDTDTVARFGGDEFVVLLTEQGDPTSSNAVIGRVTQAISQPIIIDGTSHAITPSIGHAIYPDSGTTADTLLMRSDMAMYQAKRLGRNRAVGYDASFDANTSERLQLVKELREAFENNEFVLAFQPVFHRDGRPVAMEALVRWNHPEQGEIPPGRFITVCEESGMIGELGRRVLTMAAKHHKRLSALGLGQFRIAVNVSAAQFAESLYEDVQQAMVDHGLRPGALELELTESMIMDNPERAIATMEALTHLGVSIAVDDFGTGYSSLSYLKRLPIRRLKIDRSFVRDLADNDSDRSICQSVIALAKALELETVAEGVETPAQRDWLAEHGVDELQGYFLGKPTRFEGAVALMVKALPADHPVVAALSRPMEAGTA
ncbi:putative bifunctional diguanylate cyclase/phosphodiesterase [Aerolutibacter ruishenii]|uniref:putative bifunctional diguanylate cyclase/phosphodiesterase n=1 Tax=Aerolutibacter ruishenii TaxID=686800 RepID=UPI0011A10422|nr:EAL domain-containing protein [Lysobacter ruishenii]